MCQLGWDIGLISTVVIRDKVTGGNTGGRKKNPHPVLWIWKQGSKAGVDGETMFVGGEGEVYWPQEMFSRHEVHTREILTQTETCGLYMASAIQCNMIY